MTINELLALANLTANDEIPVWDAEATGEPTKKITAQQLAASVVALASLVTGVKGNAESSYRTGNVNLTAANVGAAPSSIIRTLDGTVNIDNVLTTGIYYLNGCSGSGLPSSANSFYGMLICMTNNEYNPGTRVVQIFAYPFANTNNNRFMMRTYVSEYGWSNWTTILTGNNVAPIESGGTGVSSLAALKNILGLNANMGIQFQELSGNDQVIGLRFECKNQNNTALYGHALVFYLSNTGLNLWDITDQRNIWSK